MSSLVTKRNVILLALISGLIAIVSSGRPWVTGSLNDGVTQATSVTATGNQAVPGFFGIALVAAAAIIAAATGGRIVRWLALAVSLLASVAMIALCVRTISSPEQALKSRMAEVTGHTGEALARGELTLWFWAALFASLIALVAALFGFLGARTWPGLSRRYDAPSHTDTAKASDWDLMDAGVDPTTRQ